jgi:hypothetical protein
LHERVYFAMQSAKHEYRNFLLAICIGIQDWQKECPVEGVILGGGVTLDWEGRHLNEGKGGTPT